MQRKLESRYAVKIYLGALFWLILCLQPVFSQPNSTTPPNFKIAFLGDQAVGSGSKAVLQLIKNEGTDAVVHQGDLDYKNDPAQWEQLVDDILGPDYPYFASAGNHDDKKWGGNDGYGKRLEARMNRLGLPWDGIIGIKSSLTYKGIFIILVAPDVMGKGHDVYIKDKLAENKAVWSIASWHKNMKKMQVGGKSDDTGWGVYEESRKGGAIIATAHEHSYSRTHLLSNMQTQVVASTSDTLRIAEGKSFVFVSGLAGKSIRDQERGGEWWASIYTSTQKAKYGALFGVFNLNGVENLAEFYFKNINGDVIDRFWVVSEVQDAATGITDEFTPAPLRFTLEQNYPNPFNPKTTIHYNLESPANVRLVITDVLGRHIRTLINGPVSAGYGSIVWDGTDDDGFLVPSGPYFYSLKSGEQEQTRKLTLLK
ncbi:MAG: FlgD immunoglobulin-like domain containing protein [bacterium]